MMRKIFGLLSLLFIFFPACAEAPKTKLKKPKAVRYSLKTNALRPTVRVQVFSSNEALVGVASGTVIKSIEIEDSVFTWSSTILTAAHAVPKLRSQQGNQTIIYEPTIRVGVYNDEGKIMNRRAFVIYRDKKTDIAFLQMHSSEKLPTACLLPKDKVENIRIFDDVFIIGCRLGHYPSPTVGVISGRYPNNLYWTASAPVIFGVSGGGVYLKKSGHYIGMLVKMASVSVIRGFGRVPVCHMAIFIPIKRIYTAMKQAGIEGLKGNKNGEEEKGQLENIFPRVGNDLPRTRPSPDQSARRRWH